MMPQIQVLSDPAAVQQAAAERVVERAAAAIAARGRFSIALSGGSTPKGLYERLAKPPFNNAVDWSRVHVFWGDERYVPLDDPESSYRLARETLLTYVPIPVTQIHPMPTHLADPQAAAEAYAQELRDFFAAGDQDDQGGQLDMVLLGMGPDGHTASLFPRDPALHAPPAALVAVVENAPKPPPLRLTFTLPLINHAREVLFLVTGSDKAARLRSVIQPSAEVEAVPAQLVQPTAGEVRWMVDVAAGAVL